MLVLLIPSGKLYAQAPQQPALPRNTVSLALPVQGTAICPTLTSGSNCIRNAPSGSAASFQSAINAATCGDTIVLAAGSTYSGNFTIPSTSCSGWIVIESSAAASLPPPGTRVRPSDVLAMATVSTPNTGDAIQFLPNSNHWRLIGLEITTSYISTTNAVYQLISAGDQSGGGSSITVQSQLPAYLIFDRIYIHGVSTTNTNHGIQMDAQSVGVVDSYCDEIHSNGADSQCFVSWNGVGPFLIQNNFIQAGAEDIMFGGADPGITNLVPSDITIIGNLIQKNLAWRNEAAPYNWVVKNLVEFKNAQRVLLDGNVIQDVWESGQVGFAVLSTPRNQSGNCSWCVVQDVTATHNLIQHACMGTEIAGSDNNYASLPSARILVRNNVYVDISNANWCGGSGGGWLFELAMNATTIAPHDITIDHNTAFPSDSAIQLGDAGVAATVQLTNNLWDYGVYGVRGTGTSSGMTALNTFLSPYTWNENLFVNSTGTSDGNSWPSGTLWSTQPNVQFSNYSNANYQVLATSTYHNAGTDGKDIGVWDWGCLNNDSAAAFAGNFVPNTGCASSANLPPQPPTNLTATVQ